VIPPIIKLVVTLFMTESKRRPTPTTNIYAHLKEAIILFVRNKELRILSLASMISYAISESRYQFRSAFVALLWPVWAIGISTMLSNVGAALSFYYSGKIINKFKEHLSIVTSDILSHIIDFVALLFPNILSPLLLSSTSLFFGVDTVAQGSLFQKHFSEHQRATMGSLNALGGSLMLAVFAFGLGFLADQISPLKSLLFFQVLALIPSIMFFTIFWRQQKS
ncbi:MAG: hypothetical protein O3B87_03060, partial [bacterium]|nr:hypothetical protein [bacterium]